MNILIRKEKEEEYFTVENVIREAFWNVYKPRCDEHLMVHQLRQSKDFIPELDLIAECDGKIVGNIICSRCLVINDEKDTENRQKVIAIGPIGVLPEYQKRGIGGSLIQAVKEKATQMGLSGIVLYGDSQYYHRFGFVNAEKYKLRTPQNTNFEEFMAFELSLGSLQNISGRCYESEAFEIDMNNLNEFEKRFIKKKDSALDYSTIKEEFKKIGKEFPLKDTECIGLTLMEREEINPCGTYCGKCDDYGVVCDGCRNRNGMPIWYYMYDKTETCGYYKCCASTGKHDCSECSQLPCEEYFEYPDPNMSDEFKQMWLKFRIDNFNKIRLTQKIELEDEFKQNVLKYTRDNH